MQNIALDKVRKIHFIGIGGIGVSAIARMLALRSLGEAGMRITGSDQSQNLVTDELEKCGVKISIGHRAENVLPDTDLIIYTIAIPHDNPERLAAEHLNISAITYPEALGQISKTKTTVAVAGTHGKTTTTAMVAQIALAAQLDPTVIVGSFLLDHQSNFIAGQSDLLIAEACEYQRSFLNLSPKILIITNIDNDHLDYYRDLTDIQNAFIELVQRVPEDGYLICDMSLPNLKPVIEATKCKIINYQEEKIEGLSLLVPGNHNISNARAALSAARALSIDHNLAVKALNKFPGTWRRFEFKGKMPNGALVYDDYAHHPTEIKATLAAAKERFRARRLVVIFQPHLYSRTKLLFKDFSESFSAADVVLTLPIYAAREPFDQTISSSQLAAAIGPKVVDLKDFPAAVKWVKNNSLPDDLIITIGAGPVCDVSERLLS